MVIGLMEEQELPTQSTGSTSPCGLPPSSPLGWGCRCFVISASFAAPVKRLAKSLRESDPAKEVLLPDRNCGN